MGDKDVKSTVVKRSIVVERHKTSISIEDVFWTSLKEIAGARGLTLSQLVASIDAERGPGTNLSSAIRVAILEHYRRRLEDAGGRGEPAGEGRSDEPPPVRR
jgi:predicted DNA-binding ribbon-helix-helix protein